MMIMITEDCNLNCTYCYQRKKRQNTIKFELASEIIKKHILNFDKNDFIQIDLVGGEVFLQFELVKKICEWAWNSLDYKRIFFFISSNGTLVHGEIQEWLKMNKDKISVGISVDGSKEIHNKNRSDSYDLIDFKFFKECWPYQGIKMTVSPATLPYLSKGIIDLHKMGFNVNANLAHLCDWNNPKYLDVLAIQLKILADYYIMHPNIKVSSILDMPLYAMLRKRNIPTKWCGSGTHMVAVDTQGNEYPCQFFMPNTMDSHINWHTCNLDNLDSIQDEHCNDCIIRPSCPNCYGANTLQNGHPAIRDKYLCDLTKIRAIAVSYLLGKKLTRGILKYENQSMLNDTILMIKELQQTIC